MQVGDGPWDKCVTLLAVSHCKRAAICITSTLYAARLFVVVLQNERV